ncbi:hypothetical protein ACQ4M3_26385 [Leptolyngbya sp. AN03gr2]|uniref:hypothetical protein n=1 Tax=unclassified Leptolyngbya TaxID=2650499 RepID=UPI003D31EE5D
MAFSVLTKRSKSQDSPMLWLSLVAGSLLLHLVLLLLGRWYFSQTASAPAGLTQAPIDFVEIDPNAPPLKNAKPIAPSNTQTQAELPKAAPPQETETTQAPNSIANLPRQIEQERSQSRQVTPERSQPRITPSPSPSPTTPINQPNRSQPTTPQGQLPSDRTTPKQNPTTSPRPTTPTPNSGGTNSTPGASTPGTTTPGTNQPGTTPSPPSTTRPETPNPETPGTSGEPSAGTGSPAGSGESLVIATNVQGRITGRLEEATFRPEQFAKGTVTLKSAELPNIEFDFPSKLPVKTLNLRLGLTITQAGEVVDASVLDDSPTLQNNPNLNDPQSRADIQSIVNALILKANADGSLAFDVKMESKDVDAYRILNIQIDLQQ